MGKNAGCTPSSAWIKLALLAGIVISVLSQGISCETELTESQCRPYIEKALKEQQYEHEEKAKHEAGSDVLGEEEDSPPTDEITDSIEDSILSNKQYNVESENENKDNDDDDDDDERDQKTEEEAESNENEKSDKDDKDDDDLSVEDDTTKEDEIDAEESIEKREVPTDSENDTKEEADQDDDDDDDDDDEEKDKKDDDDDDDNLDTPIDVEVQEVQIDDDDDETEENKDDDDGEEDKAHESQEIENEAPDDEKEHDTEDNKDDTEDDKEDDKEDDRDDIEEDKDDKKEEKDDTQEDKDDTENEKEQSVEEQVEEEPQKDEDQSEEIKEKEDEIKKDDDEESKEEQEELETKADDEEAEKEEDEKDEAPEEVKFVKKSVQKREAEISGEDSEEDKDLKDGSDQDNAPEEEELIKEVLIPENLRPRDHIDKILKLDNDSGLETILGKTIDNTLKTLKSLYDNGIKPLEMLYKYRDLSNRHFGDPEIFSKPLILFMGPWSGGKSSTINYLLDNEYSHTSLRTGAEPSPAYFNILMYGEKEEVLDGTQLAADWTFSGLQKFGQGLLDRLKGIKLPSKLLEKVNVVEIPGILEIRKQVQRLFPFNDACQWFIDRADIIFLVYDPSKLDVGPETEAILDQLKGREYQTRIILNKADQVKPEELMRVQGTLIWNISPLMSSSEPPIMYSTSLWSIPYEAGAPTRLLQAQERAFLRDLREAIDKRVENKISSARRFAVRVRNHAKMVDCYLTTYYNHKTFFGNRKKISDDIIENPQKYHIYEGLSTLTNISRYDLPDPDVYKDFFKINPLYDFQRLSETCTYFRGCPINKLDVVIAYDLPELIGKHRKEVETAKEKLEKENT